MKIDVKNIYEAYNLCSRNTQNEMLLLGFHAGMSDEALMKMLELLSDIALVELMELGGIGPIITLSKMFQLCSGTDENGEPNGMCSLQIDEVLPASDVLASGIGTKPYANVALGNPVINIYAAGGCVVVTADFNEDGRFEFKRAGSILSEWIEHKGDPDFENKILSLAIVPKALDSAVVAIFHELVFAEGYQPYPQVYRLSMSFDGNQTQTPINTEISLRDLAAQIDIEIEQQNAEVERELLAQRQNQSVEQDAENPVAQSVQNRLNGNYILNDSQESSAPEDGQKSISWMRISREE